MTNLSNVKALTDAMYNRECRNRGIPPTKIGNGEFILWYELVVERIVRELNIQELSTSIVLTPVTVYTDYVLPTSFGGLLGYEFLISGSSNSTKSGLEIVPMALMPTLGNLISGTPNRMAIFPKADARFYVYLYPLTSVSGTLKINYKRSMEITDQTLGAGGSLAGAVEIARPYQHLIIRGIMAEIFPDKMPEYMMLLSQARYDRAVPNNGEIFYNLGGLEDDDIDNGYSKNFNGDL